MSSHKLLLRKDITDGERERAVSQLATWLYAHTAMFDFDNAAISDARSIAEELVRPATTSDDEIKRRLDTLETWAWGSPGAAPHDLKAHMAAHFPPAPQVASGGEVVDPTCPYPINGKPPETPASSCIADGECGCIHGGPNPDYVAPQPAEKPAKDDLVERSTFDNWYTRQDAHVIDSMSKRAVACSAWHDSRRGRDADILSQQAELAALRAEVERLTDTAIATSELVEVAKRILDRGYVSGAIEDERDDHLALVAAIAKAEMSSALSGEEG